ncbi:MAG TPA: hypothetical protein ENK13_01610 [Thermopetrobacter sp.]|nr:hypothetical protein [Thermopetrobacter sp.]
MAEIADLVATLVAEPETVKEAPPEFKGERWKAFVQDVVDLLAKHFGGERRSGVYWAEGAEAFCVRIGPTPQPAGRADGGIWAPVDPEIEWGDPLPDPGDVLVAVKERPRVPKGTLGLIRGVAADGTVLVSWSVDSATEVVRLENGYVAVPSGVDVSGVPREEVFPTGRRARLPFVVEGERRDLPVRVFVWRPGGNPGPKERRNP